MKLILKLMVVVFMLSTTKAQDLSEKHLVTSLANDCARIAKKTGSARPLKEAEIMEKINQARIYLAVQMTHLVITDSSAYYQEMLGRLKQLEQRSVLGERDSTIWLNEKEKMFLFVSALSPSRSDTLFYKLVNIWCGLTDDRQAPAGTQTLLDYKIWIYDLLDKRFHKETSVFEKIKSTHFYLKAIDLIYSEFSEIEQERQKMQFIISLVKQSGRDSLIPRVYVIRGNELEQKYYNDRSEVMQRWLFEVYHKAANAGPTDYQANYNLYRFYHNEAAVILNNLDNYADKALEKKIDVAKHYLEKSMYYGKKAGVEE